MSTEKTPKTPAKPVTLTDEALAKATGGGKPASEGQPQDGSGNTGGTGAGFKPLAAM